MVSAPKNYRPNEGALPPLLNQEAEQRRLQSIQKQKEIQRRDKNAERRLQRIIEGRRDKYKQCANCEHRDTTTPSPCDTCQENQDKTSHDGGFALARYAK